jgi:hypothetical protein
VITGITREGQQLFQHGSAPTQAVILLEKPQAAQFGSGVVEALNCSGANYAAIIQKDTKGAVRINILPLEIERIVEQTTVQILLANPFNHSRCDFASAIKSGAKSR